jgi:hypothetical protein
MPTVHSELNLQRYKELIGKSEGTVANFPTDRDCLLYGCGDILQSSRRTASSNVRSWKRPGIVLYHRSEIETMPIEAGRPPGSLNESIQK